MVEACSQFVYLWFIHSSNWHILYMELSLSHYTWNRTDRFTCKTIIYNEDICMCLFKASYFLKYVLSPISYGLASIGEQFRGIEMYLQSESRGWKKSREPLPKMWYAGAEQWGVGTACCCERPLHTAVCSHHPGAAFLGKDSIHDAHGSFFPPPKFFHLNSLYLTSLEILCFIIIFYVNKENQYWLYVSSVNVY